MAPNPRLVRYECGHPPGEEPWCPVCIAEIEAREADLQRRQAKEQAKAEEESFPIPIDKLPPKMREKVKQITSGLTKQHWSTLGGNRSKGSRSVIIFRPNPDYRIICVIDPKTQACRLEGVYTHNGAYERRLDALNKLHNK